MPARCTHALLPILCAANLTACAINPAAQPPLEARTPIDWPQDPALPCQARVSFARQYSELARQGLPEERIIIAKDWDPPQQRVELLEIRRRAFHDREALREVVACALGGQI
jgi:hypothetical protein